MRITKKQKVTKKFLQPSNDKPTANMGIAASAA